MQHAVRRTLHASRFTFHVSRFTLHVSRFTQRATRFTLHASRFTQYVKGVSLWPMAINVIPNEVRNLHCDALKAPHFVPGDSARQCKKTSLVANGHQCHSERSEESAL
jgi:hypothetical protein